jgi:hypothetical protein
MVANLDLMCQGLEGIGDAANVDADDFWTLDGRLKRYEGDRVDYMHRQLLAP